jgi:hypothetical protein
MGWSSDRAAIGWMGDQTTGQKNRLGQATVIVVPAVCEEKGKRRGKKKRKREKNKKEGNRNLNIFPNQKFMGISKIIQSRN